MEKKSFPTFHSQVSMFAIQWAPCMLPTPGAVTRTQAKVIFNWILYTCTHKSSSHSIQRKVVFPTLPLISDQSKTRKYIWALPTEGGGVQKSSIRTNRHPNAFCGMRAPQWLIFTTSIGNHRKILFSEILIFMHF